MFYCVIMFGISVNRIIGRSGLMGGIKLCWYGCRIWYKF